MGIYLTRLGLAANKVSNAKRVFLGDLFFFAQMTQRQIKRLGVKEVVFQRGSFRNKGTNLSLDLDVNDAFRSNGIASVNFAITTENDYPEALLTTALETAFTYLALKKAGTMSGTEYLDLTKWRGWGKYRLARLKISYEGQGKVRVEFDCAEVANKKSSWVYPARGTSSEKMFSLAQTPTTGVDVKTQEFSDGSVARIYSPTNGQVSDWTLMPRAGYSMSMACDHPMAADLAGRGYRTIIFDYPGHSSYVKRLISCFKYSFLSLNDFAASTQEKIAWAKKEFGKVAVVGQSMAGRASFDCLAGDDEQKKPDALVMVAPFGFAFLRTNITIPFLLAMLKNIHNLLSFRNFALPANMSYRCFFNEQMSPSDFAKFWQFTQSVPWRVNWGMASTALGGPVNRFLEKVLPWFYFAKTDVGSRPVLIVDNGKDVIRDNNSTPVLVDRLKGGFGATKVDQRKFAGGVHCSNVSQPKGLTAVIINWLESLKID